MCTQGQNKTEAFVRYGNGIISSIIVVFYRYLTIPFYYLLSENGLLYVRLSVIPLEVFIKLSSATPPV